MNEADIAEELAHAFPEDDIQREGKGGDILQTVRYQLGRKLEEAGLILYECKDTKRWSNAFLKQIKADGQTHQTPYLLLVSRTLPANEECACVRDDVVIVDPLHVRHLAWIVRRAVIETHRAERAGQDRAGKTARLYEYLRSDEFRGQLSTLVGSERSSARGCRPSESRMSATGAAASTHTRSWVATLWRSRRRSSASLRPSQQEARGTDLIQDGTTARECQRIVECPCSATAQPGSRTPGSQSISKRRHYEERPAPSASQRSRTVASRRNMLG